MLAHSLCRLCGSGNNIYLCDTPNEHSKTKVLSHYLCRECGSVYVGNEIASDELQAAYKTLDMDQYYTDIERENRQKMERALAFVKFSRSKDTRILDIGTGNGLFVQMLREAGYTNVSAHEIEGSNLDHLRGVATQVYQDFDYSSIPDKSFDLVTMLDVAEHVPDANLLIHNCHRVLRDCGVLYFHTPVVTRTDRLMHKIQRLPKLGRIGRIWQRGRTSVFHLQNYTTRSIRLLLEAHEFSVMRIDVTNELSWPLSRYVRIYLLEKQGLPQSLAPVFVPFVYPLLSTKLFNANKAVVSAIKNVTHPTSLLPNPASRSSFA